MRGRYFHESALLMRFLHSRPSRVAVPRQEQFDDAGILAESGKPSATARWPVALNTGSGFWANAGSIVQVKRPGSAAPMLSM